MSESEALLDLAEQAVDAGIARLAHAGEDWSVRQFKASGEEVTAADLEVEKVVSAVLRRQAPGIPVVGEETARGSVLPPRCWLLDPIDGTMNFTRGAPFHAISLAYVEERHPRLGVIDAPALGRRWRTGREGRLPVSSPMARTVGEAVIGLTGTGSGDPRRVGLLQSTAYRIRMQGAMSLDLVGVAEGWLDACVCLRPKPWDVAAGTALVRERGGTVLGAGGREFAFDSPVLVAGRTALAHAVLGLCESGSPGAGETAVREDAGQ
ncbi:inositol monophosphatase family protein [Streptomyces sp. DSM 41527]|uniref:inositol-phosphate phosphatase n=1 Tax=Streptomyces mooreae TaxID=3075523 RepID=A0ABU2TGP9_9ACTN|nr:inositol monophosphatase family protein [Streptomyces sp. DSM 41527]MDT0460117.1 inositol monophosphatase family protein [Streptomyces sp. DSM 41527]